MRKTPFYKLSIVAAIIFSICIIKFVDAAVVNIPPYGNVNFTAWHGTNGFTCDWCVNKLYDQAKNTALKAINAGGNYTNLDSCGNTTSISATCNPHRTCYAKPLTVAQRRSGAPENKQNVYFVNSKCGLKLIEVCPAGCTAGKCDPVIGQNENISTTTRVCTNGSDNYPDCDSIPDQCTNGATNFPDCDNLPNECSNGAGNYPECTNECANGASDYPTCTVDADKCTNGATNFPDCDNNVGKCSNGATNYPTCSTCELPNTMTNGVCTNDGAVTIITFKPVPSIVNQGKNTGLNIVVKNATQCTLVGTNANPGDAQPNSRVIPLVDGNVSDTYSVGPIEATTRFTLICDGTVSGDTTGSDPIKSTITKLTTVYINAKGIER